MKFSDIFATLCVTALSSTMVSGFIPARAFSRTTATSSNTVVYIASWGKEDSSTEYVKNEAYENPEVKVQAYLKPPGSVKARENIDGTVLVSGLVKFSDRTDQRIFDLLNDEESAFEFDKIIAFVDDIAFAKKRLLSRSARYTGLLNKLDFVAAESAGSLPTLSQLEGVKSWVAYLDGDDLLGSVNSVAEIAKDAPSVENVALLLTGATNLDAAQSKAAVDALKGTNKKYTLVAVGELKEHPEGKIPYQFSDFGTEEGILAEKAIYSRDEALRVVTECLQLDCGTNKALSFSEVYDVNQTEARLIKGLREAGYSRPQEFDHMIGVGVEEYKKAIDEWKEKYPDHAKGIITTEAWWLDPEFQKSVGIVGKTTLEAPINEDAKAEERKKEIENIAKEWAKREYFRQSMAGTIDEEMSEEDFIESVWDRAMFEGDLKYRQMNGETPDAEAELADFKAQQERKQQAMLQRAKQELEDMLDEENLGGDDLKDKLSKLEK